MECCEEVWDDGDRGEATELHKQGVLRPWRTRPHCSDLRREERARMTVRNGPSFRHRKRAATRK